MTPNKTICIFSTDSYCFEFNAAVIACEARSDGKFDIILDKTAFFPEQGGQYADVGTLDGQAVLDMRIKDGIVRHTVEKPIETGRIAEGRIDRAERFSRMQNHSGEHIVSGIVHRLFGFNNVGFHLGESVTTVDFDGELTRGDLNRIEDLANRVIYECREIRVSFPSPDELSGLEYRSKLDLTENVRIVTIDGCDVCACCAPHVGNTGEIGVIKLLDSQKYKGGTRLHMLCGQRALNDYRARFETACVISERLSVPNERISDGVDKLEAQIAGNMQTISALRRQIIDLTVEALDADKKTAVLFEADGDMMFLRNLMNACVEKTGRVCAVFAGNDTDGYKYVIGSGSVNLRNASKEINAAIDGRGGGSPDMISGTAKASKARILAFFEDFQ